LRRRQAISEKGGLIGEDKLGKREEEKGM